MKDPERPSYKHHFVLMTPELATSFLKKNGKNRPLSRSRVEAYKGAMLAGGWNQNNPDGCSTSVDTKGVLANSQHRLHAIVESGCSFWWNVYEGVEDSARVSMDTGRSRTPGDFMYTTFRCTNYNNVAAMAKMFISLEDGQYGGLSQFGTRERLAKVYKHNRESFDWAIASLGRVKQSVLMAVFAWCHAKGMKHSEDFLVLVRQVDTGENIPQGAPAKFLRQMVFEFAKNTDIQRWTFALMVARLIEGHMQGETFTRMPPVRDGKGIVQRTKALAERCIEDQAAE